MKQYGIEVVEKTFSWGEMSVVSVGGEGRGEKQAFLPVSPEIVQSDYVSMSTTQSGKPKIVKGGSPEDGWIAKLSGSGTYTKGTYGSVYVQPEDKEREKVIVITRGYTAWGAAGNEGHYYEFVVQIKDNTFVKMRPAGGRKEIDRYWLYFSGKEVYQVSEEEMEMFCDQMGVDVPISAGTNDIHGLIDLQSM